MSYILEALKKSQNERELGQVPTLVAAPATESHRAPRGKPWGLMAVGLAALAVAIALYAALNRVEVSPAPVQSEPAPGGAPSDTPVASAPTTIRAEALRGSPLQIAALPVAPLGAPGTPGEPRQTLADQGLDAAGAEPRGLEAPGSPAGVPAGLTQTVIRGDVPPPAPAKRAPQGAMGSDRLAALEEDVESIEGGDGEMNPADSDLNAMEEPPPSGDWMEMDEEIGPAEPAEPVEPPPPVSPRDARPRRTKPPRTALPEPEVAPIPEDLRQDVEAFKEELRRERSGGAPRPAAAKASAPEDPTKLRLPLEIESRLPAFFVTAHIYDTDTSKRFVVINALKYTPGDTTREGLKVEDILPDGVVLSFQGHRFYRRR
jgi:general secretion pathway protein B